MKRLFIKAWVTTLLCLILANTCQSLCPFNYGDPNTGQYFRHAYSWTIQKFDSSGIGQIYKLTFLEISTLHRKFVLIFELLDQMKILWEKLTLTFLRLMPARLYQISVASHEKTKIYAYTMGTNLLNLCNLVSISKNVVFYAFLVVRIY